jgi:hypothetical protein
MLLIIMIGDSAPKYRTVCNYERSAIYFQISILYFVLLGGSTLQAA